MSHTCHWPGCVTAVPPRLWGCKAHWFALPREIRNRILRNYRHGQEEDKRPSAEYLDAAMAAHKWIKEGRDGLGS